MFDQLQWTAEDSAAAIALGWDVFDNSDRGLEIERIDVPEDDSQPIFESDCEAIADVYFRAQEGSLLCQKALLLTLSKMQGFDRLIPR